MKSLMICTANPIFFGNKIEKNETGMYRVWGEAYRGSWWGNLRENVHLEEPGEDGRTI